MLATDVGDAALLRGGALEVVDAGGAAPHLLFLAAHAHQGAPALQGTLARLLQLVDGGATHAVVLTWWDVALVDGGALGSARLGATQEGPLLALVHQQGVPHGAQVRQTTGLLTCR